MPGTLDRRGAGFKAAAMVRFMHSMVRFNLLHRGEHWDAKTYGIPIPQIDQLPAGIMSISPVALKALRQSRTTFTPVERAHAELARYRCSLLGLPEELLPDTPREIVDILLTRFATLRKGFDDTCAALVSATMAADLTTDHSISGRFFACLECRFTRVYFVSKFMRGDKKEAAARVGVKAGLLDYFAAAVTGLVIAATMTPYVIAAPTEDQQRGGPLSGSQTQQASGGLRAR
jgi:hypothetical protein